LKVAVAILNWNGKEHLETFLPSVVTHTSEDIYVIDNGSTDGSLLFLRENFPTVKLIQLDENYGFCGGYNKGLAEITGVDYYVLLNSDVEVTENWLDFQLEAIQEDHSIVACQPKIKSYKNRNHFEHAGACGGYLDYLGYPFCRGRIFMHAEEDKGQYDTTKDVFWATGAALLIKTDVYHDLGGLDETFFAHMEEIDLCWRIKNAGYRIICCPKAEVFHLGGATLSYNNPRKTYLNFRNGLAILVKNLPGYYAIPLILFRLVLDGVAGVQFAMMGHFKDTWAIVRAHFSFYSRIPYYLKLRRNCIKAVRTHEHKEVLRKSIVFQYFVLGNKDFKDLGV